MSINLSVGIERIESFKVEDKHIADFLGSGKVAVLSSPSMILWMEHTAMLTAQKHLPEGWITVGTRVDVRHLKATKKGEEVKVSAKLKEVDGKRLVFEVIAYHKDEKIGEGIHERYIVNKEKFMEKLK